jgi:uncharacterized protein (DUF58 family)
VQALTATLRARSRRWLRRRQGADSGVVDLHRRRVYILPTRLGIVFATMLFAMLLGSLNYGNNLGLALTFLLTALGLVAMQRCHRNLQGTTVQFAGAEPCFAGTPAVFQLALSNPSRAPRYDLVLSADDLAAPPVSLAGGETVVARLARPSTRRGRVALPRFELETHFPLGLFRAWAVVHPDWRCVVYPHPAPLAPPPPFQPSPAGAEARGRGDEDFAGLKDYRPGDPPRHVAWKALARSGEMLVKEFASGADDTLEFDLAAVPGIDLEERLATLARWILDADGAGRSYALRLDGVVIPAATGPAQRERCLTALADLPGGAT